MAKWISVALLLAAALLIGCGGDSGGDGFDNTTATTATTSTTNGGTTGDFGAIAGYYRGSFSGSNTTGSQFTGEGGATIDADGGAYFAFDASVNGVSYYREFDGSIDTSGNFAGFTQSGEPATGTVTADGDSLNAVIRWQKRTTSGQVFYTETEYFSLVRQEGG
jgi:hypothetical protein